MALGDVGRKCCPSCLLPLGTPRMEAGPGKLNVYRWPGGSMQLGHRQQSPICGHSSPGLSYAEPWALPRKAGLQAGHSGHCRLRILRIVVACTFLRLPRADRALPSMSTQKAAGCPLSQDGPRRSEAGVSMCPPASGHSSQAPCPSQAGPWETRVVGPGTRAATAVLTWPLRSHRPQTHLGTALEAPSEQ